MWFNDFFSRLAGGLLVYFLIKKIDAYLFLIIFSIFTLIGHGATFAILALDIDGTLLFSSVGFFMALGAGGFWVLTAQIIMDEGGS